MADYTFCIGGRYWSLAVLVAFCCKNELDGYIYKKGLGSVRWGAAGSRGAGGL